MGKRVLLVDDEPDALEISTVLSRECESTTTISSASVLTESRHLTMFSSSSCVMMTTESMAMFFLGCYCKLIPVLPKWKGFPDFEKFFHQ